MKNRYLPWVKQLNILVKLPRLALTSNCHDVTSNIHKRSSLTERRHLSSSCSPLSTGEVVVVTRSRHVLEDDLSGVRGEGGDGVAWGAGEQVVVGVEGEGPPIPLGHEGRKWIDVEATWCARVFTSGRD